MAGLEDVNPYQLRHGAASFDSWSLALCFVGDGLQYHPMRIDPATGDLQFNSPFLFNDIPAHRVRDSALW